MSDAISILSPTYAIPWLNFSRHALFGSSKANAVLAEVVDRVPLAEERISQDCKGSSRGRDVLQEVPSVISLLGREDQDLPFP